MKADDQQTVFDTLLDIKQLSEVVYKSNKQYMDVNYGVLFSCTLTISGQRIPIFIGIPDDWELSLFDIYIENFKEIAYIPHIDYTKGKLCLYDLEGILIDADLRELLKLCISRAISIFEEGLSGRNGVDFVREFSSYWVQLPECGSLKHDIEFHDDHHKIRYIQAKKNIDNGSTMFRALFATNADKLESFSTWNINGSQSNGISLYIKTNDPLYPPDVRVPLDVEFINRLLRCISNTKYSREDRKIILSKPHEMLLVFRIEQIEGITTDLGVLLVAANIVDSGDYYKINPSASLRIYPLNVIRIDKGFLMSRVSDFALPAAKNCLLIGCGSIGSHLANELIRAGIDKITFIDNDRLKEENIYRHLLGIEYIGYNKAEVLVQYFKKNLPHLKLQYKMKSIKTLVKDNDIDIDSYDLIISATGNHNINRWINGEMLLRDTNIPCFYVWNEPLDIGCHVAVIRSSQKGCYNCFFKRKDGQIYDSTAYTDTNPKQSYVRNNLGCGGSYIPYSGSVSLKAATLCMDLITRFFDDRCQTNELVSLKGDGYYFRKSGYKVSNVYLKQSDYIEINSGSDFYYFECEECN